VCVAGRGRSFYSVEKTCIIVWLYMQVVSEDGNRVKREQPFTESDLEELQVIMSP
jgi:hypothetical protein